MWTKLVAPKPRWAGSHGLTRPTRCPLLPRRAGPVAEGDAGEPDWPAGGIDRRAAGHAERPHAGGCGGGVEVERSVPHGNVAAAHVMASKLGLRELLGPARAERDTPTRGRVPGCGRIEAVHGARELGARVTTSKAFAGGLWLSRLTPQRSGRLSGRVA